MIKISTKQKWIKQKEERLKIEKKKKKALYTIINRFTKQGTVSLSSWMMIF